jgi:putative ABC transport system permease protein
MHDIIHDLKFAFRTFVHQPAYSLVAIAVLALGIGATTAIFSVVNAVLLRPLPYPRPDELVRDLGEEPRAQLDEDAGRSRNYLDWQ